MEAGGGEPARSWSWYLSKEEIERGSPSRLDGLSASKEAALRSTYASFIRDVCVKLNLPQITIATGIVICHRFYLHQSLSRNEWQTVATACIFLASKIEDTPRRIERVVIAAHQTMYKRQPIAARRIYQEELLEKRKDLILTGEALLLTTIRFDFNIQHPYEPLELALNNLGISQKEVKQAAINLINETLRTTLVVQFKPHYIAAGALALSAKFHGVKLPSEQGKAWWHQFDVAPKQLEAAIQQMKELFLKINQQHPPDPAIRPIPAPARAPVEKQQTVNFPNPATVEKQHIINLTKPSPVEKQQMLNLPKPSLGEKQQIVNFTKPVPVEKQQSVNFPKPDPVEKQQIVNSLKPAQEAEQQMINLPKQSPVEKEQTVNSLKPASVEKQQIVNSPKPVLVEKQQSVNFPKPAPEEKQQIVSFLKPAAVKKQQTVNSPKPSSVEKQQIVTSPKPVLVEKQQSVNFLKPAPEEKQEIVSVLKPAPVEKQQTVNSPEPAPVEKQQILSFPKPILKFTYSRRRPAPALIPTPVERQLIISTKGPVSHACSSRGSLNGTTAVPTVTPTPTLVKKQQKRSTPAGPVSHAFSPRGVLNGPTSAPTVTLNPVKKRQTISTPDSVLRHARTSVGGVRTSRSPARVRTPVKKQRISSAPGSVMRHAHPSVGAVRPTRSPPRARTPVKKQQKTSAQDSVPRHIRPSGERRPTLAPAPAPGRALVNQHASRSMLVDRLVHRNSTGSPARNEDSKPLRMHAGHCLSRTAKDGRSEKPSSQSALNADHGRHVGSRPKDVTVTSVPNLVGQKRRTQESAGGHHVGSSSKDVTVTSIPNLVGQKRTQEAAGGHHVGSRPKDVTVTSVPNLVGQKRRTQEAAGDPPAPDDRCAGDASSKPQQPKSLIVTPPPLKKQKTDV